MGNPVVHFEIGCRDSSRTAAFYEQLFGWKMTDGGPATLIETETDEGIPGHITALGHEPHNYVTVYVRVDDLERHVAEAERLGARTLVPPTDVPGRGRFAWIADLDQNIVGLWETLATSAEKSGSSS